MTQEEYNELKAAVDEVALRDVHTGRVLSALLDHVGALHKVKTASMPAEAPAEEEIAEPTPIPRRASRQP